MWKTGIDYFDEDMYELIIKSVYSIFIYGIIAYRTEIKTKQSFLGRESTDRAFHRWLKIFETFPEGIALVRENYIVYSNRSLKNLLEIADISINNDPRNEKLKNALIDTKIELYKN